MAKLDELSSNSEGELISDTALEEEQGIAEPPALTASLEIAAEEPPQSMDGIELPGELMVGPRKSADDMKRPTITQQQQMLDCLIGKCNLPSKRSL